MGKKIDTNSGIWWNGFYYMRSILYSTKSTFWYFESGDLGSECNNLVFGYGEKEDKRCHETLGERGI